MENCIFCKIVSGDIPSKRLYENEHAIAVDDINPAASVHALIISKAHYQNILGLAGDGRGQAVLGGIQDALLAVAAAKGVDESGFRFITNCGEDGAQTIPHLHFHVIGGQKLSERMG